MSSKLAPHLKITGIEREALAATVVGRYKSGESIRNIASHLKRSYGFVHALLVESGVEFRTKGGKVAK